FGRTIQQFYPVTEPTGSESTFNAAFDTTAPRPTATAYDILDRVTSVTTPDNTTTTSAYDFGADRSGQTRFRTTVIDANGKQKQTANLRTAGQQVTFGYQFNRVTSITYPNFPGNNVTYTYGAASQRNPSASGNVVGRITHITDGAGTEDRLYGPLGEITQETR